MNIWLRELSEMGRSLLGDPGTPLEYGILLVLTILVLMLAMYLVGSATGIPNIGNMRRGLALVVGVGCLMCVCVGVQKYLLPHAEAAWLRHVVMFGVPVVACLLVVLPIQQAILRSAYVATLITFVTSLALAALFVILANSVIGAIAGGGRDSNAIKNRKDAVNRLLDSE
jgi:hypothetical protein